MVFDETAFDEMAFDETVLDETTFDQMFEPSQDLQAVLFGCVEDCF